MADKAPGTRYKPHKLSALLPEMAKDEFLQLKADIARNGLTEPVVIFQNQILDGRHRYQACLESGVSPKFEEYTGTDPLDFIVSQNLHRRHLTASQKAAIAVDLKKLFSAEAKERMVKGGKKSDPMELVPQSGTARDKAAKAVGGVSGRYVDEAEKIAKEAPDEFEAIKRGEKTVKEVKWELEKQARKLLKSPPLPEGKYNLILCDPPWQYTNSGFTRAAERHYPTMPLKDICALPVADLAADNCYLLMWVTGPMLGSFMEVVKAWGFEFVTMEFTWLKSKKDGTGFFMGLGNHSRSNAEFCIIARKGHLLRLSASVSQIIYAPLREHSRKPDETRDRIVKLYGDLPRIELFSRQEVKGWKAWGNQVKTL